MPIPLISHGITEGLSAIPHAYTAIKWAAVVAVVALLKYYFGGARNTSERLMHSKVVMITGGTSGIGSSIVHDLASRGAQIILLTQHAPSDLFLVDYIEDLRQTTNNQLIYAEQVDLRSLHSVRKFATKWVDNAPPRRLDMIILCANTLKPSRFGAPKLTGDGLDEEWQVNYLANFHLLSILSPAIRAQPPDRDVRIIFASCSSYIGATIDLKRSEGVITTTNTKSTTTTHAKSKAGAKKKPKQKQNAASMYGITKLALMIFAKSFQKHLSSYKRPDDRPMNARVLIVDPGYTRTPGTRRWITGGSLWGLLLYLLTWPVWWLILKAPEQGAQSFLYAAMEARYGRGGENGSNGGWYIKECREMETLRKEVDDEEVAKQLWEFSEEQIQVKEKESAKRRALEKAKEEEEKKGGSTATSTATNSGNNKARAAGTKKSRK
ncbi:oxidoreductase, short chain dehydrogenase/reductase family [Talaromyces stipitatus ATCC 10500]|uniref:Oxidoreductase, short chain dehydrogenase/reductase family n=1 Tax=Talaromyces stipitatus (strain ATCC 10500 / CBS 375.48 / QM 6759 / NRRL 1006) TaxID=441959 RepID=B8M1P5_TALSN|nr:oxidoreductase, short chain dehydrogenase/reductase family [Talaromyces stipitatus ATCC 10500]EED22132.1 oxidoreductase, short chain dehydrogenase/reductase family [Talaromyces stipitatus ATCC 10500]